MDWIKYERNYKKEALKVHMSEFKIKRNLYYAKKLFDRNLPIIYDTIHFAKLVGITVDYIYRVSNRSNNFYRHFIIPKRNGSKRNISEPLPNLKKIQEWILHNILYERTPHPVAKAFVPGVSIKDNVKFHRRQKKVLKLDISNFFHSIKREQIYLLFNEMGYNEQLSMVLSRICTLQGFLPQGAPTSPMLSNLVFYRIDEEIVKFCIENKIRYTRYADDMTFSGEFNEKRIIGYVNTTVKAYNFTLNFSKTRLYKEHQRQLVTGIVVNRKPQLPINYRNKIRQSMYYIKKFGVREHLKKKGIPYIEKGPYLKRLEGMIGYCLFINPKDSEIREYQDQLQNNLE